MVYNTVTNRGFVKGPRGVVLRSKAINYLYLVAAIVERHDGNSGRRPVESSLYPFISGCVWSYDVRTGLEASEPDDVGQFP